jgi:hypothetical protein
MRVGFVTVQRELQVKNLWWASHFANHYLGTTIFWFMQISYNHYEFVGDSFIIVKGGQEGKYLPFLKYLLLTHKKCNTPCVTFTSTENYKFKSMLILLNVINSFFFGIVVEKISFLICQ